MIACRRLRLTGAPDSSHGASSVPVDNAAALSASEIVNCARVCSPPEYRYSHLNAAPINQTGARGGKMSEVPIIFSGDAVSFAFEKAFGSESRLVLFSLRIENCTRNAQFEPDCPSVSNSAVLWSADQFDRN